MKIIYNKNLKFVEEIFLKVDTVGENTFYKQINNV